MKQAIEFDIYCMLNIILYMKISFMLQIQESKRMAKLLSVIRLSLAELDLGLKGDLTMSANMENIEYALIMDKVPSSWSVLAYPSLRPLSTWLPDLKRRAMQLAEWTSNFALPNSIWLPGPLYALDAIIFN